MKKEKLQIIILISIIVFGISYAYYKFLFLPQWSVIQDSTNRLLALDHQHQKLLTYQKNQRGLQQEIKTLEAKVEQLKDQLPNQIDKPPLMVGLYTLAKQHSVEPQSITFEQAQRKGDYQELRMSFSCFGKTADLLAMINELQFGRNQRLVINTINLTGSQQEMRAELEMTAYATNQNPIDSTQKQEFMNSPIGVDSPVKIFEP